MAVAQPTTAPPDGAKKPAARGRGRAAGSAGTETAKLVISPIKTELLKIHVVGTAPLIVSRFSEKAKAQMLAAQQGRKKQPEKRDPHREYLASLYRAGLDEEGRLRFGLPAMAFKMATIGAGRYYGKAVKMTELRQFLFFYGVSVPTEAGRMVILDGRPRMREDYVRLAGVNHPADLRYRGCFYRWEADLYVSYTANLLERDSVVSLIDAGGLGVGVGEWRPERNGEFGTFKIAPGRGSVQVLRQLPPLYSPDMVDYDVYHDEDEPELTMADFAALDAPPELLTDEEAQRAEAQRAEDAKEQATIAGAGAGVKPDEAAEEDGDGAAS